MPKKFEVISDGNLNIRLGPGKECPDVGNLPPGAKIEVLEGGTEEWAPVQLWVNRKYLEEVQEQEKPASFNEADEGEAPFIGAQKTSPAGLEFIKKEEGCILHVYNDPADYPTIGVGHLIKEGEEFGEITEEEALELLAQDLRIAETAINRLVKVTLSQNQFDALASFTFNCGTGALEKSTLLKLLNQGQYGAVPGELAKWVKAGGKTMPGLVERRKREGELWGAAGAHSSQSMAPPPLSQFPVIGRQGKWKGIIGQPFNPETFREYVRGLSWVDWQPEFIVLHNTGEPCLANRPDGLTGKHIMGLAAYYRDNQGWSAGPHLFVDDRQIWVFTPLTTPGVHAPSWNSISLGVEMLGDYDREEFDSGRGALVKANALAAVAILSAALDMDPETIRFHREDPRTTHHCPGDNVDKAAFIQAVKEFQA